MYNPLHLLFELFFIFLLLQYICANNIPLSLNRVLLSSNSSITLYQTQNPGDQSNRYCQICCIELQPSTVGKKCGSHTLCKYTKTVGPACKGFIRVGFTTAEKRLMVDAHNTIRNKVALGQITEGNPGPQPTAANMRAVEWDEELAKIAERWASQCIYSSDICRDVEKFPVGQNIGRGVLATDGELTMIHNWFLEQHWFNQTLVESYVVPIFHERNYARYSQLVWADTYLIGCARVIFQASRGSSVKYVEHLICNYGPTGNIPNQKVYKVGKPCSECHEGTACTSDYEALCTADYTEDLQQYLAAMPVVSSANLTSKIPLAVIMTLSLIVVVKLIKLYVD